MHREVPNGPQKGERKEVSMGRLYLIAGSSAELLELS